jgi:hydroxymethylpyrimidine/phosphomethylpyrimidine kinase
VNSLDGTTRATPPRALTIAGSDSGGGAGAQCDLKTFLACGVHGMSALTAVTVQNSLGVSGFHEIPADVVAAQVEAVATDIGVGATKTGMLASASIIEAVAEVVQRVDVGPFVVDPVCASQHGEPLLHPDALAAMRTLLFPLATIVTPNLPETRLLTGLDVRGRAGMSEAVRVLHAMGPRWVLVKGGYAEDDPRRSVDLLFDGETEIELVADRHPSRHTHGTGDALGAATTAALASGIDVVQAVQFGKRFVTAAIADSFPVGAGVGPVGHFWRIREDPV